MIEEMIIKAGVPTYVVKLEINLSGNQNEISVAQQEPNPIGLIYGLSVDIGGTHPTDNTRQLIDQNDSRNLWLTLKYNTAEFVDKIRLSRLGNDIPNANGGIIRNYFPCNIPRGTDWQGSKIYNYTGITNKTILLNLYFIDVQSLAALREQGIFFRNGVKVSK